MKKPREITFRFTVPVAGMDDQEAAIKAMLRAVIMVARKFDVCPLCLAYNTADTMMEAEERGVLKHLDEEGHQTLQ
jgi:hypothetical protein